MKDACALKKGTCLNGIYTIKELIGRGGSAFVYLAEKTIGKSKTLVLIKELWPKYMSETLFRDEITNQIHTNSNEFKVFLENMKKEQAFHLSIKKNGNPYIFDLHDIFTENNTEYIVMSYERGIMLSTLMESQLSLFDMTTYIIAILNALASLHEKGILHLDITPYNIFVSEQKINEINVVKLIDFNNCIALGEPVKYDRLLVSRSYASLELRVLSKYGKHDDYELTYSSDLYSVAAIFYEMITGNTPAALPFLINLDYEAKLEQLNIHPLSKKICTQIFTKGLQSDSQKRYSNISEMLSDFKRLHSLLRPDYNLPAAYEAETVSFFAGREKELKGLESMLAETRCAHIYAEPRIGKSSLINRFCCLNADKFDIICRLRFYRDIKHTIAESEWSNILNEEEMSIEELYTLKKSLFMHISLKTLLIIEDVRYDENIYECMYELLGNPSLSIIASAQFREIFPKAIILDPLKKKDMRKIIKEYPLVSQRLLNAINGSVYLLSLIIRELTSLEDKESFLNEITDSTISLKEHHAYDELSVAQSILSYSSAKMSIDSLYQLAYSACVSVFDLNSLFDCVETDYAMYDIMLSYKSEYNFVYDCAYKSILHRCVYLLDTNQFKTKVNLLKMLDMVHHITEASLYIGTNYENFVQGLYLKIYTHMRKDLYDKLNHSLVKSRDRQNIDDIYEQYKIIAENDIALVFAGNALVSSENFYNLLSDFKNFCIQHFGYQDKRTLIAKMFFSQYINGKNSLYVTLMVREKNMKNN